METAAAPRAGGSARSERGSVAGTGTRAAPLRVDPSREMQLPPLSALTPAGLAATLTTSLAAAKLGRPSNLRVYACECPSHANGAASAGTSFGGYAVARELVLEGALTQRHSRVLPACDWRWPASQEGAQSLPSGVAKLFTVLCDGLAVKEGQGVQVGCAQPPTPPQAGLCSTGSGAAGLGVLQGTFCAERPLVLGGDACVSVAAVAAAALRYGRRLRVLHFGDGGGQAASHAGCATSSALVDGVNILLTGRLPAGVPSSTFQLPSAHVIRVVAVRDPPEPESGPEAAAAAAGSITLQLPAFQLDDMSAQPDLELDALLAYKPEGSFGAAGQAALAAGGSGDADPAAGARPSAAGPRGLDDTIRAAQQVMAQQPDDCLYHVCFHVDALDASEVPRSGRHASAATGSGRPNGHGGTSAVPRRSAPLPPPGLSMQQVLAVLRAAAASASGGPSRLVGLDVVGLDPRGRGHAEDGQAALQTVMKLVRFYAYSAAGPLVPPEEDEADAPVPMPIAAGPSVTAAGSGPVAKAGDGPSTGQGGSGGNAEAAPTPPVHRPGEVAVAETGQL